MFDPFLFVHIPKTAGTSFRKGADEFFNKDKLIKDYGTQSVETSKMVLDYIYKKNDVYGLLKAIQANKIHFMAGHYHLGKYLPIFNPNRIVTFVREPVQRVISEYKHFVRNNGYTKSLQDFYRTPNQRNKQKRLLSSIPLEATGFIGITEEYSKAIKMVNHIYEIDIPILYRNIGKVNIEDSHEVSPEIIEEIKMLNNDDSDIYNQVYQLFKQRLYMIENGLPYVRGRIREVKNGKIIGWASYDELDEPVEIEVWVGDHLAGKAIATEYQPHLKHFCMNRLGCVGFSLSIGEVKSGDKLRCFVASTRQELFNGSYRVS